MQRFVVVFFLVALQVISDVAAKRIFPVPKFSADDFMEQPRAMEKRAACTKEDHFYCGNWESQGLCTNSLYKKFMTDNCEGTCGWCEVAPTPAPEVNLEGCLDAHNAKRALHGANPLVWDATLAEHAKAWADHLVELGQMEHAQDTGEGENLYWGSGPVRTCEEAVESWYSEISDYDYNNPPTTLAEFYQPPAIGHFTQVVWKATTAVGAGLTKTVNSEGISETYVVARYSPPGNLVAVGSFTENVPPLV